ncbi:protein shisa-like-1a isoform X1 [Scleropages formosus]|uniref:protein shisa-like-1a isoform X1 n=1 Tax=Scleropages formosus TaxID=113540 RepID=UPI0008785A57|nr:protein shisa-like-1a isoform X1 [Scleropages formosus]
MTLHSWQTFQILAVILLMLSTAAHSAHFRVCEPYSDHRGRYHFGFHCPRLSDNKTYMFCCQHNNTAFKYCCNETEFQNVMQVNMTINPDGFSQQNYSALIGVWVYGFFIMVLLALDFLYYSAINYELCRVYLEKWGLGGQWLKQARSQWSSPERQNSKLPAHPEFQSPHSVNPRHEHGGEAESPSLIHQHASTAW